MKPLPPVEEDEVAYDVRPGWALARLIELVMEIQTGPYGSSLHQSDYGSEERQFQSRVTEGSARLCRLMRWQGPETLRRLQVFRANEGDIRDGPAR